MGLKLSLSAAIVGKENTLEVSEMKLAGVLPYARSLLQSSVEPGDIVVDATAGNGMIHSF